MSAIDMTQSYLQPTQPKTQLNDSDSLQANDSLTSSLPRTNPQRTIDFPVKPQLTSTMKTDQYLTLCLEQAAKSPLHYRHGCIVVRGGKVIGQGYNDYRPGFDGGALKHGRVANGALDGAAIADLKEKLKKRKQNKSKDKHLQDPLPDTPTTKTKTFTPFEGMNNGGGHHANTPLSMHSEMMAIHSALSASSTLACSAFSREKPCFKLPRCDKRKERLRRDVLKSYVERIFDASAAGAQGKKTATGKAQGEGCGFEASASQPGVAGASRVAQRVSPGGASSRGSRRGRGGSGCVSEAEWRQTPLEAELEQETEEERVRVLERKRVSVRPAWETDTARFFTTTAATAVCV